MIVWQLHEEDDGGEGHPDGAEGEIRQHSESINLAARRFRPVVPVTLQASTSLKHRLKGITSPRMLIAPTEQRSDALPSRQVGGSEGRDAVTGAI